MKLGSRGLSLIKSFEGFVPYVYDDLVPPVKGKYREWDGGPVRGTLTIGYGHTDAAKHPLKCTLGTRLTEKQATDVLDYDLDECEADVNRLVKVPISQGQFDALVSFTYNCGAGNLKKLIVPLNKGDRDGTREKFDQFIRSKGKVLNGLVRRRDAEQALWDDDYGRVVEPDKPVLTPKEVEQEQPPKPLAKSTTLWASIVAAITTAGSTFLEALADWKWLAAFVVLAALAYIIWERNGKPDIRGWFKSEE